MQTKTITTINMKKVREWEPLPDGRGVILLTHLGTVQVIAVP
jgi:hypothetical protein